MSLDKDRGNPEPESLCLFPPTNQFSPPVSSLASSNISGSFVDSSGFKFNKDEFPSGKLKVKKAATKKKDTESHGITP